jgi:hypothetical protein
MVAVDCKSPDKKGGPNRAEASLVHCALALLDSSVGPYTLKGVKLG